MRPPEGSPRSTLVATLDRPEAPHSCCPTFHQAVELVGKRWTGAILYVLLESGRPLRFSEIAHAVPDLSDRLLSERMKELEQHGIVERRVTGAGPVRVDYVLTERGRELSAPLGELKRWADRWMD
jgi:DNA-binding HxlR family transcriptional regulator